MPAPSGSLSHPQRRQRRRRHRPRRGVAGALVLALAAALLALGAGPAAADQQVCGPWDTTSVDGGASFVQNDRWGTDATQCITARDGGFSVDRADGSVVAAGPPKSYPSIVAGCHWGRCSSAPGLPVRASQVGGAHTTVGIDTAPGRWDAAYDVWFNSTPVAAGQADATELMIWLDRGGDPVPVGSPQGRVVVDGASWTVWQGPMSGSGLTWGVVSFVRDVPATSADLPLKPFVDEAAARGMLDLSSFMTSVQFGFEPWDGGAGLAVHGFSYSPTGAAPAPAAPAPAPGTGPVPDPDQGVAADGVVVGAASGRCLDVAAASHADGAKVQLWDCNGTAAQSWVLSAGRLVNTGSGKCLDVAQASTAAGARVQLWTCLDGGTGQQWRSSGGAVVNPASGLCLDARGGATGDGTPLITWACTAGKGNQTWS